MNTMNQGRRTMTNKMYEGKSTFLFIGFCLFLTVVSFGSDSTKNEDGMLWNTRQSGFSLVKSATDALKWDCLAADSIETDTWSAPHMMNHTSRIISDAALKGKESAGAEERPQRGKLAFVLRAGSSSITADGYGSSFTYGLGLYMNLSERIGLEIILDRFSVPVSKDFEGMGTGKLQVTPLVLNGQWRFPLGRFVPYAAAGVGFYFINFEADPKVEPFAEQDLVYDDRFALHLGGGIDVQILQALDFFADLRYSIVKTWIQDRDEHHVEPAEQNIFNLNTLALALGLRYYF
jgi:hypothetical protein